MLYNSHFLAEATNTQQSYATLHFMTLKYLLRKKVAFDVFFNSVTLKHHINKIKVLFQNVTHGYMVI